MGMDVCRSVSTAAMLCGVGTCSALAVETTGDFGR